MEEGRKGERSWERRKCRGKKEKGKGREEEGEGTG